MSQKDFVKFYDKHLNSPEGAKLRAKIDGAKDAEAFCAAAVEGGKSAGFNFTADDVREVMKASEAQMAKEMAQASGELSEDQLKSVAGGTNYLSTSIPRVNIRTMPKYLDKGQLEVSTVMCPW